MSERQESTTGSAPRTTQTVVCEKHGLRYNPVQHDGCARCRREAGEKLGASSAARGVASNPSAGGSAGGALGVAAALVFVVGLALFWSHRQVYDETFGGWNDGSGYEDEMTPEEREELEAAKRELQKLFGDSDSTDD